MLSRRQEKMDHLNIAGRNVKYYNHFGKEYCSFLFINTSLSYDPAIAHLIIYLKDKTTQKSVHEYSEWFYSYSQNFKQPMPSICEWLNKMLYIPIMKYYLAI